MMFPSLCRSWTAFVGMVLIVSVAHGAQHERELTRSTADHAALTINVTMSHTTYSDSSPERILLKVDLLATDDTPLQRRPLNLALVIDASGSMNEDDKFAYAMQAAELVVENLSPHDVISIVGFSESAFVLSPAGRAVNKDFLYHRLAEVAPQGWTNLSSGLLEAFAQIESQETRDELRHVIVITDGNANRGVTSPKKLERMARAARRKSIGLSTFGCGTDFDENVLLALAEAGGGRYTYIRSAEQIPGALATELGGLLEVVAQNVELRIQSIPNTTITRTYGRLGEGETSRRSFLLGDLRAGEHSQFLIDLLPLGLAIGDVAGADVTLTWDDIAESSREEQYIQSRLSYSSDDASVRAGENVGVTSYARVLDLLERAQEALLGLDDERFQFVRESFDRVYQAARAAALAAQDQKLLNQVYMLKHVMAELSAVNDENMLHGHDEARRSIQKQVSFQRYLLEHHRTPREAIQPQSDHDD